MYNSEFRPGITFCEKFWSGMRPTTLPMQILTHLPQSNNLRFIAALQDYDQIPILSPTLSPHQTLQLNWAIPHQRRMVLPP